LTSVLLIQIFYYTVLAIIVTSKGAKIETLVNFCNDLGLAIWAKPVESDKKNSNIIFLSENLLFQNAVTIKIMGKICLKSKMT